MRRYFVDDLRSNNQGVELKLSAFNGDLPKRSLRLNALAGGMKQKILSKLETDDCLWIDLGEDCDLFTEENASKIKKIYSQGKCSDVLNLMYER